MICDYERKVSRSLREHKTSDHTLYLKALDETGVFAGYASVFDVVDSQQDVMQQGAFSTSLRENGGNVKLLWQHAMDEPIGIVEALYEDARGLFIKGRLLMDVTRAREAYALLKEGVVQGLSIGYCPRRYRIDDATGIRTISQVDLWEISLVTFPANDAARITVVKQEGGGWIPLAQALDHALCQLDCNPSL